MALTAECVRSAQIAIFQFRCVLVRFGAPHQALPAKNRTTDRFSYRFWTDFSQAIYFPVIFGHLWSSLVMSVRRSEPSRVHYVPNRSVKNMPLVVDPGLQAIRAFRFPCTLTRRFPVPKGLYRPHFLKTVRFGKVLVKFLAPFDHLADRKQKIGPISVSFGRILLSLARRKPV